jgi:hypothetical protein
MGLRRLRPDNGTKPDPSWRPHKSLTESMCPRCNGQGYLLQPRPNPGASVPIFRAVRCPDCTPLV